jgi:uncharacterized SAM-binding protein YcdF (DUF218 family)
VEKEKLKFDERLELMFFALSNTLGFLAHPSNVVIVIGLIGAVLLRTRFTRTGWSLSVGSLLLLAVLGFSPIGNALMINLEERFPVWEESRGTPHGILVLGGAVTAGVARVRGMPALNEAAERLLAIADLARRYPDARILVVGTTGAIDQNIWSEAEFAARLLEGLGIAGARITAETRSRNTAENARFAKELANPRTGERWLLVTSAYHMPRAVGAFRQAGFPVEAYPVDWRTGGPADIARPFFTLADGLKRTDTVVREWVGLAVYWVTGRTPELFPGPATTGAAARSAMP